MKNNIPNILLLAFVILNSCSRQTNINTDKPDVKPSNVVTLSSDQLSDAGIELGRITKMPLSAEITCNGTLEAGDPLPRSISLDVNLSREMPSSCPRLFSASCGRPKRRENG